MNAAVDSVLINGSAADWLPVTDRGLNYGDGVFRTLRVARHEPVAWQAHMTRLRHDCERLLLPFPDATLLRTEARHLFRQRAQGVLKIVITRGSGGRGYAPAGADTPRRILSAHALPEPVEQLQLMPAAVRLARQPALAGVKHLNRLEQVLARQECAQRGVADALMLDSAGFVIATTMRNLLLRIDGRWLTPALTQAGVAGATRARIMGALAGSNSAVRTMELTLDACRHADAAIACNSVGGAVPVTRLADRYLPYSFAMAARCRRLLAATAGE